MKHFEETGWGECSGSWDGLIRRGEREVKVRPMKCEGARMKTGLGYL